MKFIRIILLLCIQDAIRIQETSRFLSTILVNYYKKIIALVLGKRNYWEIILLLVFKKQKGYQHYSLILFLRIFQEIIRIPAIFSKNPILIFLWEILGCSRTSRIQQRSKSCIFQEILRIKTSVKILPLFDKEQLGLIELFAMFAKLANNKRPTTSLFSNNSQKVCLYCAKCKQNWIGHFLSQSDLFATSRSVCPTLEWLLQGHANTSVPANMEAIG